MPRSKGRTGRPWRRLQAEVWAEETHCWICRRWVDQSLHHTDPMSRSVDHVIPLWFGGAPLDRSNCRLAHRRCNTVRGNRMRRLHHRLDLTSASFAFVVAIEDV